MSAGFRPLSDQINQQASDWFTLLQSDEVSDHDRQLFNQWLSECSEHVEAFEQVNIIWQRLEQLSSTQEAQRLQQSLPDSLIAHTVNGSVGWMKRVELLLLRFRISALAIATVVVVAVSIVVTQIPEKIIENHYLTDKGEIKSFELADGSTVILGAKSEIKTRLSDSGRAVQLVGGEAFFSVIKDLHRPFIVSNATVEVQVVGTQFDVHRRFDSISVTVQEGMVNVTDSTAIDGSKLIPSPLVLTAGQRIIKPDSGTFGTIEHVSKIESAAWRNGRLIYRNASLIDVISDANRYFDGNIVLNADDLADLKVTVTLKATQVALLPDMLSQTLPIVVSKDASNQIVIARKL